MYGDASVSLRRCVRCFSAANASASISRRVSLFLIRSVFSSPGLSRPPSPTSYTKIGQRLIFHYEQHGHNAGHVGKTKQQLQLLTWIRVDWRPPPYTYYRREHSKGKRITTQVSSVRLLRGERQRNGRAGRPARFYFDRSRRLTTTRTPRPSSCASARRATCRRERPCFRSCAQSARSPESRR